MFLFHSMSFSALEYHTHYRLVIPSISLFTKLIISAKNQFRKIFYSHTIHWLLLTLLEVVEIKKKKVFSFFSTRFTAMNVPLMNRCWRNSSINLSTRLTVAKASTLYVLFSRERIGTRSTKTTVVAFFERSWKSACWCGKLTHLNDIACIRSTFFFRREIFRLLVAIATCTTIALREWEEKPKRAKVFHRENSLFSLNFETV